MDSQLVLLERKSPEIAKITLNRPEKRNAMNTRAQAQLREALQECRDAKVVIITGSGPAFCAGVDLKELYELRVGGRQGREFAHGSNSWLETMEVIRKHPAICIAAVNGYALGGGVTLVNVCDLAIAARQARFGMPEIGFGTYPALAGPSTQLRILRKHAAWMVLTAEWIDGETAERWGLVNKCVDLEELDQEVERLAQKIAGFDTVALDWSKKALNEIPSHISDWTAALEFGGYIGHVIRASSAAMKEGLQKYAKDGGGGVHQGAGKPDGTQGR